MKRLLCPRRRGSPLESARLIFLSSSSSSSASSSVALRLAVRSSSSLRIALPPTPTAPSHHHHHHHHHHHQHHATTTTTRALSTKGGRFDKASKEKKKGDLLPEPAEEEKIIDVDPSTLELPPGTNTTNMTIEEIQTLADAYRIEKEKRATLAAAAAAAATGTHIHTHPKPDPIQIYAPSNDPADHLPGNPKCKVGSIYTLTQTDLQNYFPGPWTKPSRVPFETGLQSVLGTPFFMIRPPALEILQHLYTFTHTEGGECKFPKMGEVERMREEWKKAGGFAEAVSGKGGGMMVVEEAEAAPVSSASSSFGGEEEKEVGQEGVKVAAPPTTAAVSQGEEEEEEDDEYDLFGEEEDEDAAQKTKSGTGETTYEKKRDTDLYGTLKRLAVDDLTLIHPDQTYPLPLTPPPTHTPTQAHPQKSIFLLSGPRGVGKTATLYHTIHAARRQGWMVFFVPSAYEYMHEGGLVRPSPFFQGYFDTPDLAQTTLRQLGEAHGHQLASLPIQNPQALSRLNLSPASSAKGTHTHTRTPTKKHSLLDLCLLGLKNRKLATTCLIDLKTEMETQKTFPVLFAIDEYSEWFHPSTYHYAQKKIEASRLCVVKALRDLIPTHPHPPTHPQTHHTHICVVAARSESFPRWGVKKAMKGKEGRKRVSDLPPPLPPPKLLSSYDVPVSSYTKQEFETMYMYIAESGLWGAQTQTNTDVKSVNEGWMSTGGHPGTWARECVCVEKRVYAPQNKVGKASEFAPKDFMLADLLEEEEEGVGGERVSV